MKRIYKKIMVGTITCVALVGLLGSCMDDVLNQIPTAQLSGKEFWDTEENATYALYGAYSAARNLFDSDYFFDGQGDYTRIRTTVATSTQAYICIKDNAPTAFSPSKYGNYFDLMYETAYALVNRTNYVIDNTRQLIASGKNVSIPNLEVIIAEARFLRALAYFRLIECWGDVPYFDKTIESNSEVQYIERSPLTLIKDSIIADLTYACEKLPMPSDLAGSGRASKVAALAFRGKVQLYWACWNKFGWPELTDLGTFTPSSEVAASAYAAAAADFKSVAEDFGLTLFRNGEPGNWGTMGDCSVLPNYFYLFLPTANNDPEYIFSITHGGVGTGQSEDMMRQIACRSVAYSQCVIQPRFELIDRYQSTETGDYCPPVVGSRSATLKNGAYNPNTFLSRDYRMKATILWEGETMQTISQGLENTGYGIYKYKQFSGTANGLPILNSDGDKTGLLYRKFVRNYVNDQDRSSGDQSFPLMRLADVYLMYAEAINEANNGPDALAIELVNRVRHRGNLPPLTASKTASKDAFFDAVEQERIVELILEGHRAFDLRRWRRIETVFGPPQGPGVRFYDTQGAKPLSDVYKNTPLLVYQQNYIFKIPQSERNINENLIQNVPWL